MTPRQRVLAMLQGDTPDRVPVFHTGFSSSAASVLLGREACVGGGVQQWREAVASMQGSEAVAEFRARSLDDAYQFTMASNQDVFRHEYWRLAQPPSQQIDDHTFLFGHREGSHRIMRYDPTTELFQIVEQRGNDDPKTVDDLRQFTRRHQQQTGIQGGRLDLEEVGDVFQRFGEKFVLRFSGPLGLPFDQVWLEAMATAPDLVGQYLDMQAEDAMANADVLADVGEKVLFGGGDLASGQGPFYSPQFLRDLLLPRLQRITAHCDRIGIAYLFGSDGNLWPLVDDLFGRSGVKGYFEVDGRAGMDLRKLRAAFPDLVLIGNISSQMLHHGTPQEVIDQTRSCVETAKEIGRTIVGCSNYVVAGTPEANVRALVETIERHRDY